MILPQNSSVTPQEPKCKHGSFCSIFHKLSEYSNLEITPWGKQGLLVIFTGNSFTDFRKKIYGFYTHKMTNRTQKLFGTSEMTFTIRRFTRI
jgi:homoserine trans-succinylase